MLFTLAESIVALAILAAAVPQPVAKSIGAAVPISKRSTFLNADNSVDVNALTAHVNSAKAKFLRSFTHFERNTGSVHPTALNGSHKRDIGEPLTSVNQIFWCGDVTIGTPSRTFTLELDTGSSDFFVAGIGCDSDLCDSLTLWNPKDSSTAQPLNQSFDLGYADGSSASGSLWKDTVTIAGHTATGQTFGAAVTDTEKTVSDGIIGMAFQSLTTWNASPFFQTLISEGRVASPVFSFKLDSFGGELWLGGSNPELYTGDFTYIPVIREAFWEVKIDNVVGNGPTILNNIEAIIDTDTTLIFGDPILVSRLYNGMGARRAPGFGPGYYTFECDSFPSISFGFGGKSFPISASTLNIGRVSPDSSECVSGLVGADLGTSSWIMGSLFLRNYYTQFDVGNLRVGFATLA